MRSLLAVLLLTCLAAGPARGQTMAAADSVAVLGAVAAYDAAWSARDTTGVERGLAPSYRYFTSTGDVWTRRQLLALLAAPAYRVERADRSAVEPRLVGTTAVAASRWQGQGTYPGGRFDDHQRCRLVLVVQGGSWRLLAEHCTQVRAAPNGAAPWRREGSVGAARHAT